MDTPSSAGLGNDFISPEMTVGYFGVTKGMRVADFGVGRGYYAILLAKIIGDEGLLVGLDIIQGALDHLKVLAEAQGIKNIKLVRANLEILGGTALADNSQDFVVLANILFQSEKKEDIIREAHRVLKSAGGLVVIDWRKGSGGVGPPDGLRMEDGAMRTLVEAIGFEMTSLFDGGKYHYGIVFHKK